MNRLVTLLGVMALAALVWAQGTTGISGTITNADTGQPIAGALVGAWQNFGPPPDSGQMPPQRGGHRHQRGDHDRGPRGHHGQLGVRSDSTGFYEIADLRPGKYVVSAQAMGFEPATYPDTVTVDSGKITTGINLALQFDTTLGAATGHVTDAVTQQPIAGAFVCTWHQMLPDSCHRRPEPDSGLLPPPPDGDSEHGCRGHRGPRPDGDSTDAGGYYRINYLRPGNYIVSAQASGYASSTYPETVVVAKCETTFGINFALQPGSVANGSKASAAGLSGSGVLHQGLVLVSGGSNGSSTLSSTEYWNGTNWATDGVMAAPVSTTFRSSSSSLGRGMCSLPLYQYMVTGPRFPLAENS